MLFHVVNKFTKTGCSLGVYKYSFFRTAINPRRGQNVAEPHQKFSNKTRLC